MYFARACNLLKLKIKSWNAQRRRQRADGQKIKWSNKQKQKTSLHVTAHFFVHFFAAVVAT